MTPAAIFLRALGQLAAMLDKIAASGAAIGKADFDGYHRYAPGFSFEAPTTPR